MTIRPVKREEFLARLKAPKLKTAENKQQIPSAQAAQDEPKRDVLGDIAARTLAALAGGPAVQSTYKPPMRIEEYVAPDYTEQDAADANEAADTAGNDDSDDEHAEVAAIKLAETPVTMHVPDQSVVLKDEQLSAPTSNPEKPNIKSVPLGIRPAIRPLIRKAVRVHAVVEPVQAVVIAEPVVADENCFTAEAAVTTVQDEAPLNQVISIAPVLPSEPVEVDLFSVAEEAFPGTRQPVAKALDAAFAAHELGNFIVGEDCLTFDDGDESVQITATQAYVSFLCSETNDKGHGFCLAWKNRNGKDCSKVIPMPRVMADWNALLGELGDEGLFVLSPRHLKSYLLEACSRALLPEVRLITEIGFFPLNPDDPDGAYGFMLPSGAILPVESELAQVKAEDLRYRPPFEHKALGAYTVAGTHAQWKEGVAPAEGNVLVVFCACAVLASVMLKVSGGENCGFHLHGLSSSGKSTAGQVGMSVIGCAADPQSSSKPTTFGSWSATDNGRELMAACASGSAMFQDELDSSPKGMSITIYPLMNGSGKVRMRSAGGLSKQHFWRLLVLSTGELSLYERIMREPQREAMLGELLRFLDIPVDNLPRDPSLTVEQAQALAQTLKQRSGEIYGSACVAFVQWLFSHYQTQRELRDALLSAIEVAQAELCCHLEARRPLRAAHKRAVRHFALVLAVGRWAGDGVLPFSVAAIERAVFAIAEAWLDNFPSLSEEDRLLDSIRRYLRDQRENIVSTATTTEAQQAGRVPKILWHDGRLYMAPEGFLQACGEMPMVKAGKVLDRLGVLYRHSSEGQKVKMTMWPSLFRNLRYYALDTARLLGERELAELLGAVDNGAATVDDEGDVALGDVPKF